MIKSKLTTEEAIKKLEKWCKWRAPRKGETALWYETLGGESRAFVECRADIRQSVQKLKEALDLN